ncbi:non-muscle caldesmon-like isoform X3 [Hippocampus comes]|uniref:non-muscle caldesmon-like isoform X3 n=1 Tax=Hippocampus comes TaxID=109280 RepID=UPI00094E1134|nr:PREDICTED: non-muscle caldesmon-like isoform X3 [Hippocampus comes]
MSAALLRRNSSRQGLQNLIRLTAQRSVEDAEEAERERRRRARDQSCRRNSDAAPAERAADPTDDQHASKPGRSPSPSPEEDEGFGDWTQRRQQSGPQRPPEGAEGWRPEDEDRRNGDAFEAAPEDPRPAPSGIWAPSSSARVRCGEEGEGGKPRPQTDRPDSLRRSQVEERQPTRVPSTAKVFLLRDSKADADAGQREVTSRHTGDQSKSKSPRCAERGETEAGLEAERRLEKIRQGLREKESQELEQLKRRHARAEQELEELAGRRELRRRLRSQEERRQQDERRQRLANEEEEHERMKEEVARRRMDAAERMKMLSGGDPPEAFSPVKTPTHKDTDSLKVGVANLITQWVKGQPDGGRPPPSRAADVKCGDVMRKKNMWEVIGDSSGRSPTNVKGAAAPSKTYTFVVTGHGKYKKISSDQEHATNRKSDLCPNEY